MAKPTNISWVLFVDQNHTLISKAICLNKSLAWTTINISEESVHPLCQVTVSCALDKVSMFQFNASVTYLTELQNRQNFYCSIWERMQYALPYVYYQTRKFIRLSRNDQSYLDLLLQVLILKTNVKYIMFFWWFSRNLHILKQLLKRFWKVDLVVLRRLAKMRRIYHADI